MKKLFQTLVANFKWLTLPRAFLVVLLATFLLAAGAYFYPYSFFKYYYDVETSDIGNPVNYFDFFVRNGGFKVAYFLLLTLFVAWIGRFVVRLFRKKPIGIRSTVLFLAIGVMVSVFIYRLPPYYLPDLESYYGSEGIEALEALTEAPSRDAPPVRETGVEFCGNQIDFFFLPYDAYSIKAFFLVKLLEEKISIPINYHCLSSRLNEDILCKKNHGVEYFSESGKLAKKWVGGSAPATTFGCKITYKGVYSVEAYEEIICREFGICEEEQIEER